MFQVGDIVTDSREGTVYEWEIVRRHEVEGAWYMRCVKGVKGGYYRIGYERANYGKHLTLVMSAGPDEIEAMFS